jgi:hypothetical protein
VSRKSKIHRDTYCLLAIWEDKGVTAPKPKSSDKTKSPGGTGFQAVPPMATLQKSFQPLYFVFD